MQHLKDQLPGIDSANYGDWNAERRKGSPMSIIIPVVAVALAILPAVLVQLASRLFKSDREGLSAEAAERQLSKSEFGFSFESRNSDHSTPNLRIRARKVCGLMPSALATPKGPSIRP